MSKVATTPTKKGKEAECKICIHFWKRDEIFAICTHPVYKKSHKRKIVNFDICDLYEKQ